MEKIGGVICGNCNDVSEQGPSSDKQEANPKKEIIRDCKCPRSKEEWLLKHK